MINFEIRIPNDGSVSYNSMAPCGVHCVAYYIRKDGCRFYPYDQIYGRSFLGLFKFSEEVRL